LGGLLGELVVPHLVTQRLELLDIEG